MICDIVTRLLILIVYLPFTLTHYTKSNLTPIQPTTASCSIPHQ